PEFRGRAGNAEKPAGPCQPTRCQDYSIPLVRPGARRASDRPRLFPEPSVFVRRRLALILPSLSLLAMVLALPTVAQGQPPCPNLPMRAPGPTDRLAATTCDTVI